MASVAPRLANYWSSVPARLGHSGQNQLIIGCGILLTVIVFAVTAGLLLNLRDRDLAEKKHVLDNLTLVLAEQIDRSFQSIELIQTSEIERIKTLGVGSTEDLKRLTSGRDVYERLKGRVETLPFIDAVVITDPEGRPINISRSWPAPNVKPPDHDPILAFKSDPQLNSVVGGPIRSPLTGRWLVPITRKIKGRNGEFLGAVTGVISLSYFEQMFAAIADKPHGSIALFRRDGTLLARFPEGSAIGRSFPHSETLKLLETADHGVGMSVSVIDGEERLIAARRLGHFPMALVATSTVADALANWKRSAASTIIIALLTGLLIGGAVFFSIKVVGRKFREQGLQRDAALGNMSQGLCMFDAGQRLIVCNDRYAEMYGLNEQQIKPGTTLRAILEYRVAAGNAPENTEQYIRDRLDEVSRNQPYQKTDRLSNGRLISIVHKPLAGGGWIATHEDVTALKQNEDALVHAHQELVEKQFAIDQAVVVSITDAEGTITYANDNFCKISGFSRDELVGANHRILKSGLHSDSFYRAMYRQIKSGQVWRGEVCNKAKDGSLIWADTIIVPTLGGDGKPVAYMAIRIDITARKQAEEKIAYMARHDALTGLDNRASFNEKLGEVLALAARHQGTCTVLLLDLDGFKNVNDTLGHGAGDRLLKELAARIKSSLRETDVIARLGGDEFSIIQRHAENPREAAVTLAVRLLDIVPKPISLDGHYVNVGTSIGIAMAPEDGVNPEELMKKADLALYRVKAEGRNNFRFFDEEMSKNATTRLRFISDLRAAMAHNEFELHYQPIFDTKTRQPCSVEALVRWRHPVEGLIAPDRFIPLAEESGLMQELGGWILERACSDASKWPENIKVAVNLSATQFRTGNLFDVVLCALVESGLPAERLELEITESVLMRNTESVKLIIKQFKNIGVSIALDDFGTGYSSLSYLTMFRFDKIKIDKSFTQHLTGSAECAAIVASALTLARGLDILVTAEGVETKQQFELLRVAGVQQVQGYLFGRPCPADALDFSALEQKGQGVAVA